MNRFMIVVLITISGFSQDSKSVFPYEEFLGYVKKYHPNVKQANLEITKSEATLMEARGAFDPKIEVDYDHKRFADKEYYALLSSSFKIPTWYGIELKAGFDQTTGAYLNPQQTLPAEGLASIGLQIPLGRGLLINERMASLRMAKMNLNLSQQQRRLQSVAVLYEASLAYFNWKRQFAESKIYEEFTAIAQVRVNAIQRLIEAGDRPAVDSIEAVTNLKTRQISMEDARFKLEKAKLELSNFLWLENDVPIELQDNMIPEPELTSTISESSLTAAFIEDGKLPDNHPKINALQVKIDMLQVEKKLKSNALLPQIDLGYYYLAQPDGLNQYDFGNHKIGVNFNFPLFLRKERAGQQLTKLKINNANFELRLEKVILSNQIKSQQLEITTVKKQLNIVQDLITNHKQLLLSEERLFFLGESSLFLINNRENNLVAAQLSEIAIQNRLFISHAGLFKIMANIN